MFTGVVLPTTLVLEPLLAIELVFSVVQLGGLLLGDVGMTGGALAKVTALTVLLLGPLLAMTFTTLAARPSVPSQQGDWDADAQQCSFCQQLPLASPPGAG